MTQNIYDTPEFFEAYGRLGRSVEGLDGAAEWPALRALLPDLHGKRVLDIGCGYGWFCRWAHDSGAAQVLGIDVSEKMLARARQMTHGPAITYARADGEQLTLDPAAYDLVYSSLTFHYIADFSRLASEIARCLVPGGYLVCSVEHPIYTAPSEPGWMTLENGRKVWPLDGYLVEGSRSTDWLAKGVIKYHRTVATYVNELLRSGLVVSHVEEWGPTDAQVAVRPALADERQRPPFLLLAARRAQGDTQG
jgi:SAM-dependent methyltransferase